MTWTPEEENVDYASKPEQATLSLARREFLVIAALLVYASHAIPSWLVYGVLGAHDDFLQTRLGTENWYAILTLLFSLALVTPQFGKYGLRLGNIRDKWPWLLLLSSIPIIVTAIVYPRLPVRPFSNGPAATWLISPLAQDILFAGYFYEKFRQLFPGTVFKRLPMERTIFVTAAYFAFWHSPAFFYGSVGYTAFQLVYTFFGACLIGFIRQWSGSIVWITAVHMAVNFIAVKY